MLQRYDAVLASEGHFLRVFAALSAVRASRVHVRGGRGSPWCAVHDVCQLLGGGLGYRVVIAIFASSAITGKPLAYSGTGR